MRSVHVEMPAKLLRAKHSPNQPKDTEVPFGSWFPLVRTEMQVGVQQSWASTRPRGCHRK